MNDQKLMNSLIDFSDLRNNIEQRQKVSSKHSEFENDQNSNEAIIKSFKELRQKLKLSTKQNSSLKQESKFQKIKLRQSQEAVESTLHLNMQLKQRVASLTHLNEELKKKVSMLKQSLDKTYAQEQELQFTRSSMLEMKLERDHFEEERKKLFEVSIQQKMGLQQQINRLQIKAKSDQIYIQKLEADLSRCKETIMKLENVMKKMEISHEEDVFTNKWTRENFETQHLQQTIKELEKEMVALKNKNKKQKQRKLQLQDKVIELQELAGLCNIKAETYAGEINVMGKKNAKLQKKLEELKTKLKKVNDQKLQVEEKFTRIVFLGNQMVAELKRQQVSKTQIAKNYQTNIKIITKGQSQTFKFTQTLKFPLNGITNFTSEKYQHCADSNSDFPTECFSQTTRNYGSILHQKNNNEQRQSSTPKTLNNMSRMTFGERGEQNELRETLILENKVRRERDQMERMLKQKSLRRKIDTSQESKHYNLREDYIKTIVERRY